MEHERDYIFSSFNEYMKDDNKCWKIIWRSRRVLEIILNDLEIKEK